jgi:peptidoglycan/LPS O-acetylase OafA/YrhL
LHGLTGDPAARLLAEVITVSRSAPLDVLRGLAVTVVLGRHAFELTPAASAGAPSVLVVWQRIGWSGVDLFFVLSGFLIGQLLVKELFASGRVRVGRFLVRRGFRIYPPFYLLLGLTLLIFRPLMRFSSQAAWSEALFLQDYVTAPLRIWNHTWSLAVEEQFYLSLPLLLLLVASLPSQRPLADRLVRWLLALIAVVLVARVFTGLTGPFSLDRVVFPAHLRFDALFVGVVLAVTHVAWRAEFKSFVGRHRWHLLTFAAAALMPIALWPLERLFIHTIGFTVFALGWGCLVAVAAETEVAPFVMRPLSAIGQASYSIYLFHLPVHALIEGHYGKGAAVAWPVFLLYVGLSLGVGALLHILVERPALALRDRLIPTVAVVQTAASERAEVVA